MYDVMLLQIAVFGATFFVGSFLGDIAAHIIIRLFDKIKKRLRMRKGGSDCR